MSESTRTKRSAASAPRAKKESVRERHERMLGEIDAAMAAIDAALQLA
ncbi:MAG TPA: hypothetical protein VL961_00865 [Acidimicrobiales bacterium]|nr:hypothetical protein [Acidimicrobiales bacterium]